MSENENRVEAKVIRIWDETPTLKGVELEVPADAANAYTTPGQYVVLHVEGQKPLFMAVANGPGSASLELLLGQGAAETMAPEVGKTYSMDPPAGKGYPIDIAKSKNLLLFCVGSGISAIRSVVEYVRANRDDFGTVTLFHGAHTPEEHAYRGAEGDWNADRIDIVRANSKPWVQDIFRAKGTSVDNAVAFVCGMKPMVQGVTDALVAAGLDKELVRQNF